jgi:Protein  of unknown function (DUF3018)
MQYCRSSYAQIDRKTVARYHCFMTDLDPKRQDKFRAYRARKKAAGLREVRFWVPDVHSKEFWEASVREAEILKADPSEEVTMQWIEALQAEDPGMWD